MAEPGFEPWHPVSYPGAPGKLRLPSHFPQRLHLLGFVVQDATFWCLHFLIWKIGAQGSPGQQEGFGRAGWGVFLAGPLQGSSSSPCKPEAFEWSTLSPLSKVQPGCLSLRVLRPSPLSSFVSRDLAPRDITGTSDPFARVFWGSQSLETSVSGGVGPGRGGPQDGPSSALPHSPSPRPLRRPASHTGMRCWNFRRCQAPRPRCGWSSGTGTWWARTTSWAW